MAVERAISEVGGAVSTVKPIVHAPPANAEDAVARGDHKEALALCARDHGAALGRLCFVLTGSQAEADELTHEILLLAYDGFASYRGEGSLRAWLFGIARRVCARHVETRTRQVARLRLVQDDEHASGSDDVAIARERATRAREALAQLKPTEREALLLRYDGDLSFREVAQACGIDEAAARKRVSRALSHLRELLQEKKDHGWK